MSKNKRGGITKCVGENMLRGTIKHLARKSNYMEKICRLKKLPKHGLQRKLTLPDSDRCDGCLLSRKEDRSVITADAAGFSLSPSFLCSHFLAI